MSITKTQNEISNPTSKRFTFLIDLELLSQIKLISYLTNQKLSQTINDSIIEYIIQFEKNNNTSIKTLINHKFNKSK
jgi:hypothetical protein|tara:strand:- start:51 stop:281 length:231 start_codon:yes stop_codon:yes gene_type:complete